MNVKSVFLFLVFGPGVFNGYSFDGVETDSLKKNAADTNLTGLQFTRPGTGAFFYDQTLGNLGSASRPVDFRDGEKEFFNWGINAFKIYEFGEAMNFDLPKRKTFSELKFINGSKKEQNFSIEHFQKLTNEIAAGLDFGIAHSDGFYNKQVSSLRNFNIYGSLTPGPSPKERGGLTPEERGGYSLLLSYLSNRIISQENGGLVNDSAFEFAGSFDSKTAGVNFNDVRNQLKSKVFYVEQRYDFKPPSPPMADSLFSNVGEQTNDSLVSEGGLDSIDVLRKRFYLKHVFKYERRSALFTSADSIFEEAYYDTTMTYDSLFTQSFFNELSLNVEHVTVLKGKAAFYLEANHQYFGFYQVDTVNVLSAVDTVLRNISVRPGGSIEWENGLGADFYFEKSFNDLKFDFYKAGASVSLSPNPSPKERGMLTRMRTMRVQLSLEKEMRNPDFVYSVFNSNHFIWFNQFNPIDFSKVEISLTPGPSLPIKIGTGTAKQRFKVSAAFYSVKDLTYFDEEALPQQFHERVNVLSVDLFHSIKLGKFHLVNDFKYQHADKKEVVRLPDFSSYTSFFYDGNFFKRALYGQFGVDVRYCTLYFADAYMPATRQFFLQDEKEIGNYAYVDVFANFRLKTFRFFVKIEHLNAGFTERVYYTVPHYPMPGRSIKFGIVWSFFD